MMARRSRIAAPVGAAAVIPEGPAEAPSVESIVQHSDGFYWLAGDGRMEFGPFSTLEQARADRDRGADEAPEPGETLQEAEREVGIADWIDPETGEPAEGQSRPHLDAD